MRFSKVPLAALMFCLVFSLCTFLPARTPAPPPETSYLYKTMFVQAAPGKLMDLIRLCQERMPVYDAAGDERPFWWRHTQGDKWDLMMLFPMESYSAFYSPARASRRAKAAGSAPLPQAEFTRRFYECAAWHEDLFVEGPPLETVKKAFGDSAYYHIEIFVALPGKRAELYKEREMENAYARGIGRPETLIFTQDQGGSWDIFTLGFYRDVRHWADSGNVPKEKRDAAARAAGFADADSIGPYMRTLIQMHRDTMGVAIR